MYKTDLSFSNECFRDEKEATWGLQERGPPFSGGRTRGKGVTRLGPVPTRRWTVLPLACTKRRRVSEIESNAIFQKRYFGSGKYFDL